MVVLYQESETIKNIKKIWYFNKMLCKIDKIDVGWLEKWIYKIENKWGP